MRWTTSARRGRNVRVIFLDTNVLAYEQGGEHDLRAPCKALLKAVSRHELEATTTPEAIQEFAHVHARRRGRSVSSTAARHFATLLAPLRLSEPEHLETGLELWARYEDLGCFDAVLAAVALDSKHATIVSADRAFAQIPGLHHVYPDAEGLASLGL